MSDQFSYQPNSETRGTTPIQFFEADGGAPPAGTKATPRPSDRPRELPPDGPAPATLQRFECEDPSGAHGATATRRPRGQDRASE
jgi:hypothetical protein